MHTESPSAAHTAYPRGRIAENRRLTDSAEAILVFIFVFEYIFCLCKLHL